MATADPTSSATPPPAATGGPTVPSVVVQALAAIGTGIGVLGFVILCGGAVIYIRLKSAGLPAIEGVARVPREVLVATGAELLVPAVLVTVLVVGLLLVIQFIASLVNDRWLKSARDDVTTAKTAVEAVVVQRRETRQQIREAGQEAIEASEAAAAAARSGNLAESDRQAKLALAANAKARELETLGESYQRELRERSAAVVAAEAELDRKVRRDRIVYAGIACLALLGFEMVIVAYFFIALDANQLAFVIPTAVITSLVAFAVYAGTQQFAWFAVAAFLAIGTVFGMTRFYGMQNDPKVAPAAVLRAGHQPMAGFVVADTGGLLLLGQGTRAHGEMVVMESRDVHDLVVGKPTSPKHARVASLRLLRSLCAQYTADSARVRRHLLCTLHERQQVARKLKAARREKAAKPKAGRQAISQQGN